MLQVLFVRHGESEANRENRIMSWRGDPALTERGYREAKILAEAWSDYRISAVYASPLKRTMDTAAAFTCPGQQVIADGRLHEIALGRWDGKIIADIEAEDGDRYRQWKQDPELGAPDGGEALSAVARRLHEFLTDIVGAYGDDELVVAVTHSDCLKALLLSVLGAPWQSAQWIHWANTAGYLLEWRNQHWQFLAQPIVPVR